VFDPDPILALLSRAVARRGGDDLALEARYEGRDESFVRFGCSTLLQASRVVVPKVTIRALVGGGVAEATTTSLEPSAIDAACDRAIGLARAQGGSGTPPELLGPGGPEQVAAGPAYDDETAVLGPDAVADTLALAFARARRAGVDLAGRYVTGRVARAVVNSAGLARWVTSTRGDTRVYATEGTLSGYSGLLSSRASDLDVLGHADRAIEKCVRSRSPVALEPGAYDVILEPAAVAELIEWLGGIAFTPRSIEDGTSPLSDALRAGRTDVAVTGPRVSLVDDGWTEGGLGLFNPFDAEGGLKERVILLDQGVGRGVVHDRATGRQHGCRSTGHAVSAEDSQGSSAMPANLFFAAGTDTTEDLLGRVERGLWITSFHYVNGLLEPRRAVMTGLTRHGTFLIDDGRLSRGVQNLRFTDSILAAFARIEGVTAARSAVPTWWSSLGANVVPTLLIRGLQFTGTTTEKA
jgi:PmbA protein